MSLFLATHRSAGTYKPHLRHRHALVGKLSRTITPCQKRASETIIAAYLLDELPLAIDHQTVLIPLDDILQSIVCGMGSPQQGE